VSAAGVLSYGKTFGLPAYCAVPTYTGTNRTCQRLPVAESIVELVNRCHADARPRDLPFKQCVTHVSNWLSEL
jgi:hypothetical protein